MTRPDVLCPVCGENRTEEDLRYPKCAQCRRDHERLVRRAETRYVTEDINVDADARLSRTDNGVWVQAWVWLEDVRD